MGIWAEHRTVDLPYRAVGCAGGWLCAVTCTPACQHVPCRGLPSTMLTARQPDELSVQSNSHLSSHSTPPPGRSHCFTFLDLIALFSNWCMFFSVLLIWLMVAILSHRPLHWDISTKHCRAIGWLHNTGWQVTEVKPGGVCTITMLGPAFTSSEPTFKSLLAVFYCIICLGSLCLLRGLKKNKYLNLCNMKVWPVQMWGGWKFRAKKSFLFQSITAEEWILLLLLL